MREINIAADTSLGKQAIEEVERYVRQHGEPSYKSPDEWPIQRTQIMSLRQIATNEPGLVSDFAEKQRQKAEARFAATKNEDKKRKLEAEIAFWELVKNLCDGKPTKVSWSLTQMRDQDLPTELQEEKQPPGAKLSQEQQQARKQKREQRERWQRQWEREYYPAFFQRFSAHYLYTMAMRTQDEGRDKGD